MKFAYADPPYIRQARKHYSNDPNCAEVNQRVLIETLMMEFPDGWALSCSSQSLKNILGYCPDGVRIMAWTKPMTMSKSNLNPGYAWEPVIVFGGRKRAPDQAFILDHVRAFPPSFEPRNPHKTFVGQKPAGFCYWLFEVLNINPDDEFVDIFPGSGAVGKCWKLWCSLHARREGCQLELIA